MTEGAVELWKRTLTGLVLLPLVLAAVWSGGLVFAGMLTTTSLALSWEWRGLAGKGWRIRSTSALMLATAGAGICGVLFGVWIGLAVVGGGLAVGEFVRRRDGGVWWGLFGYLWFGVPMAMFGALRGGEGMGEEWGLRAALWLVLVVAAVDVGAYVFGKLAGGAKLAPGISPGKTWSGLFGGLLCGMGAGSIIAAYNGVTEFWWAGAAGVGLGLCAQGGDLAESWVKRKRGKKDAGGLLPGHGGVFDRVDGLLTGVMYMWILWGLGGLWWLEA